LIATRSSNYFKSRGPAYGGNFLAIGPPQKMDQFHPERGRKNNKGETIPQKTVQREERRQDFSIVNELIAPLL